MRHIFSQQYYLPSGGHVFSEKSGMIMVWVRNSSQTKITNLKQKHSFSACLLLFLCRFDGNKDTIAFHSYEKKILFCFLERFYYIFSAGGAIVHDVNEGRFFYVICSFLLIYVFSINIFPSHPTFYIKTVLNTD